MSADPAKVITHKPSVKAVASAVGFQLLTVAVN